MTITSPTNRHLKEIRKLSRASARAASGRFVAEGEDLYAAAHAAGVSAVYVLCTPGLAERHPDWHETDAALLKQVSRLGSGTRVIAVFEERWAQPLGPLVVALWGVGDPGNVGTTIRAAQAFGASCVAIGPGCADPYGPKAVRASMGGIFSIPLARIAGIADLPGEVVALAPGDHPPLRGPLDGPLTLVIGGERDGLPAEVLANCDRVCAIPQAAGDSLNAAMAATVALYEATRMAGP
jgi:TrmH family RNA methyltransferase